MKVAKQYFICPNPVAWYLASYGVLKRKNQVIKLTNNNITGVFDANNGLFIGSLSEIIKHMKDNPNIKYNKYIN